MALSAYLAVSIIRWTTDSGHAGLLWALVVTVLLGVDLLHERNPNFQVAGSVGAAILSAVDLVSWLGSSSSNAGKGGRAPEGSQQDTPLSPV